MIDIKGFNPQTGEWNDSLTGDYLWGNANIGEAVPNVMTPFTWSSLSIAYAEMNFLPGYHSVGNIGGRPYQNGTVMFAAFKMLGKDPLDLINEMGSGEEIPPDLTLPELDLPRRMFLVIFWNGLKIRQKERAGLRGLPDYLAGNPAWCQGMRRQIAAAQAPMTLLALWPEIFEQVRGSFWRMVSTALRYASTVARLRADLTRLVGEQDAQVLLSNVSGPRELLASLGPVVGLAKVARGELSRQAYLDIYGHRGPYETEFSAPRPAEDPTWLDQQLAALVAGEVDVGAMLDRQRGEYDAAWERFQRQHPQRSKKISRRLAQAAQFIRVREAARSESIRQVWVARDFARQAGQLTGLGDDIFFLTYVETLDLLAGRDTCSQYIPARKATHQRYCDLPVYPSVISGPFDPFQWAADPDRRVDFFDAHVQLPPSRNTLQKTTIRGMAGAVGCVEGRVRRIDTPEEGDQLQVGEILVAPQTNIGWTLLFPLISAVVTDVGAPLTHAAIVARELGIPAVVGCGDATRHLQTGDLVRVDGSAGTVEILRKHDA